MYAYALSRSFLLGEDGHIPADRRGKDGLSWQLCEG